MKRTICKAHKKRNRVVLTRFKTWNIVLLLYFVLLPMLPSIEAYILPASRRSFGSSSSSSSSSNNCIGISSSRYIHKGGMERIVDSELIHEYKVSHVRRKNLALSMSTSSLPSTSVSIPTSSSSIEKERWRRRKYVMTTFILYAFTWPIYASFKVLEMGLVMALKLSNFSLSLPLISLIGKPTQEQVRDLFNVKLPMLKYLWPRDKGFFSQEFRSKLFLVASFLMMFLGERICAMNLICVLSGVNYTTWVPAN